MMNQTQIRKETLKELVSILTAIGVDKFSMDRKTKEIDIQLSTKYNDALLHEVVEFVEETFMNLTHGHYQ